MTIILRRHFSTQWCYGWIIHLISLSVPLSSALPGFMWQRFLISMRGGETMTLHGKLSNRFLFVEGINLCYKTRCVRNNHKSDFSFSFTRLMEDLLSAHMDAATSPNSPRPTHIHPSEFRNSQGFIQSLSWVNCSHQFPVRCPLTELAQFLQDCYPLHLFMEIAEDFAHLSSSGSL